MFGLIRRLPFFRLVALVKLALLARRHLGALTPEDRRRAAELVRNARHLSADERKELRALALKLEPGAFAGAAINGLSPIPIPKRFRTRG
jgi:signal transduction histidine kinase